MSQPVNDPLPVNYAEHVVHLIPPHLHAQALAVGIPRGTILQWLQEHGLPITLRILQIVLPLLLAAKQPPAPTPAPSPTPREQTP